MGCGSKSLWVGWVGSTHGGSPALTVDSVRRLLPGCTLCWVRLRSCWSVPVLCHCLCLCVRQVMRMSIGTNPRVAKPVLGAALGISSTFRTWTPASVVNVCWVRPSEKFWLGVDISIGIRDQVDSKRALEREVYHLNGAAGQDPHPVPAPRQPASVPWASRRATHCKRSLLRRLRSSGVTFMASGCDIASEDPSLPSIHPL